MPDACTNEPSGEDLCIMARGWMSIKDRDRSRKLVSEILERFDEISGISHCISFAIVFGALLLSCSAVYEHAEL